MLSIEEKIGQLLLVGFHGTELPDHIREWLESGRIGGVILFARNVETPAQLVALTRQIHDASKYPALISIDQEGGRVARLREGFTESPGAMALAAARDNSNYTRQVSNVLAKEMRSLGINWTYAPVCDLTYNRKNASLGIRSFGSDVETVSRLAAASVTGFQEAGVAACAKHFPGLGNTAIDTHLALPSINADLDNLRQTDLAPYRAVVAADVASVMTTHTIFTTLDEDYPATLSPIIIQQLLREELAFDGVVTTDCMEMHAISHHYGMGESAVLAILAGVDIVLFSHTREMQEAAYEGLVEAALSGSIPETRIDEALRRIQQMKARYAGSFPQDGRIIRSEAHLTTVNDAARNGVVAVKSGNNLPLQPEIGQQIALIEFSSHLDSVVVESNDQTQLGTLIRAEHPNVQTIVLDTNHLPAEQMEYAETLTAEAHVLILATRSAHLSSDQIQIAQRLMAQAQQTILLCLQNPFDAAVFADADVILCTNGDSPSSLQAAADAIFGKYVPDGRLPVSIVSEPPV